MASPLRKSKHAQHPHGAIKPDGEYVTRLHRMARRLLAYTIDPNMTGLDQRGRAGAGFYDPGVPQPFIETLAFQTTPLRAALTRSRGSALCFLTRSDANRLRLKTL